MKGAPAYDCRSWHGGRACDVIPIDIGGFAWLWCKTCRQLVRLEAVSPKHETIEASMNAVNAVEVGQ